jgi:hypothetical protein
LGYARLSSLPKIVEIDFALALRLRDTAKARWRFSPAPVLQEPSLFKLFHVGWLAFFEAKM